jgi:hypothetical protein
MKEWQYIQNKRGVSHDMLWLGSPSFVQNFSSISVLLQVSFTKITMSFYYILPCSDIAYDKYKSMHHHKAYVVCVQVHKKGCGKMNEEMESNHSYI